MSDPQANINYNNSIEISDSGVKNNYELETVSAVDLQKLDLPPLRFVVANMLPQGLSILASPPKYGKSWLVLDLCLSVASGATFLGHTTNRGGCLYLALEDSLRRLKDRTNQLLDGAAAPEGFDYSISSNDLSNGLIERLTAYIKDKPETTLIVIDTFQKVRGKSNKNDSAYASYYREVGKLKEFADKHKICLLLVHHLRKMADESDVFNRISGTNGIAGATDTMMVLSKAHRTDTETTLSIAGRDLDGAETVLTFDKDRCKWRVIGSAEEQPQ